jgi:hypothetical protein
MDLVVVFHLPLPGGCIQAGKLVLPGKDPPSGGRVCAGLLEKVCVRAPNCPLGAIYYPQTTGDSIGASGGTVYFRELLFIDNGRHHHVGVGTTRLHHMPGHGGGGEHDDSWGDNTFSPIHQEERRLPCGPA